ncbi:MAG: NYN domain-containing protein [Candidatus Paceibacterota bacterium]|jgi:uncharacterized LabA/DUF88 family protein
MNNENQIKRLAFIDANNTLATAKNLLGFSIDWIKLYDHLKKRWTCDRIFFYSGIALGDNETGREYDELEKLGYEMRTKTTMVYKRKDRDIVVNCSNCGHKNIKTISMGYENKSNCDVELTLDVLENVKERAEILIFTGDGDFEFLIKYIVEARNAKVWIVSNTSKNLNTSKRFSTKLKSLLKNENIKLINLDSWREKIKRHEA